MSFTAFRTGKSGKSTKRQAYICPISACSHVSRPCITKEINAIAGRREAWEIDTLEGR